jgi:hypothetical protein
MEYAKARGSGTTDLRGSAKRHLAVFCLLLLVAIVLFWPHISGKETFIGDSDRLNSLLNIRMFQIRSLQTLGWVPAWSENMFGGYGMAGLHWMQPNYDPIGYLLSAFSVEQAFWISGLLAAAWIVLSGWTAYLFIHDTIGRVFPATVGALLYSLSVFSLHRTAQIDSGSLVLILIPVGMLLIRRVQAGNLAWSFLGLAVVMSALATYGFLQEVSYTFILFGLYAVYRSVALGRLDIVPLLLLSTAAGVGLIIAAPRLITVMQDFQQLERTGSFWQTDFNEIVRFFHEGLLGRFQGERATGSTTNLHEGIQLLGSTLAALLIVSGLFRPQDAWQAAGSVLVGLVLSAMIVLIVPYYGHGASYIFGGVFGLAGAAILLNFVLLGAFCVLLWRCESYLQIKKSYVLLLPDVQRDRDAGFHLLILGGVLAAVVVREVQYLVYLIFARVDFTHSRLSIIALLPMATLAAIFLNELTPRRTSFAPSLRKLGMVAVGLAGAFLCVFIVKGPLFNAAGWIVPEPVAAISNHRLIPAEILKTIATVILFAGLVWCIARSSRRWREVVALGLGCAIAFEAVIYAWFKYNGPHTHSYPIAFQDNNYSNAPACVLVPPHESAVQAVRERLETDAYRAVLLADGTEFPAYAEPHISQFWDLRLLGGYSAGIPLRLASLPWPKEAHQFRAIRFSNVERLPLRLLALINVKYIISVNQALYFNLARDAVDGRAACPHSDMSPDQISVVENPFAATPRQFFASEVLPANDPAARLHEDSNLQIVSFAEGLKGPRRFVSEGAIKVRYAGDIISIDVDAAAEERFLVLNEMFSPRWKAYAGAEELPVLATNTVMRGLIVPPGVRQIEMRYFPFISSWKAGALYLAGGLSFLILYVAFRRRRL